MKKIYGFLLIVTLVSLGACKKEANEVATTNSSISQTTHVQKLAKDKSKNQKLIQRSSSTSASSSSTNNSIDVSTNSTSPENVNETNQPIEKRTQTPVEKTTNAEPTNDLLSKYSDEQIEYARVWLATIGNMNIQKLVATRLPAGSPIDIYDEGSVGYPTNVVFLDAETTAQGMVVYSSNHNGTINIYDVPSHWQLNPNKRDPESIRQLTQSIVDTAHVKAIPTGDPQMVAKLISILTIK